METAAFARIETHVYGAVPVKVELNEADKDLVGKEEDLSTTEGRSAYILGRRPRLWISRARLSEFENYQATQKWNMSIKSVFVPPCHFWEVRRTLGGCASNYLATPDGGC